MAGGITGEVSKLCTEEAGVHWEGDERVIDRTISEPMIPMDGTDYRELIPKPSNDPNDPLNWSGFQKHMVLTAVAMLSFSAGFDIGAPASGFVEMSKEFDKPISTLLNSISVMAIFLGVGGLFWVPLAHRFGRTPVYVVANLIGTLGNLGTSLSKSYSAFMGSRVVSGIGGSGALALGGLSVKDLFFVHERGRKMGIWTLAISLSSSVGILLDGFVTSYAGWRWMMWLTFFKSCFLVAVSLFCLPETLYHRHLNMSSVPKRRACLQRLKWKRFHGNLTLRDFLKPFVLLKYPSIIFPAFYYGNVFGFTTFGIPGSLPFAFREIYGFGPIGQGLMAVPLIIGTALGEPIGGPLSDWVVRYEARKRGGERHPEDRLRAAWLGGIITPIGLMMMALCLHYRAHWIATCFAIAFCNFGVQVTVTIAFTYPVDCYEHMAGEISLLGNMGRQMFSFYVTLYLPHFFEAVGYGWVFGIYSILSVVLFWLMVVLMVWGAEWRKRLGMPSKVEEGHEISTRED